MSGARPEELPPSSLPAIVDRLLACLRERVELEAVVLFGSRARDDAFDESDWDFALISSDFHDLDPLARARLTVDCRLPLVDLVHLTPEELLEPDSSYLRCAILEEGRAIVDAGIFTRARDCYAQRKSTGEISFQCGLVDASPGTGRS